MAEAKADPPALGLGTKLAYGIGQAAEGLKNSAFGSLLLFFYVQVLGVPPGVAGSLLLLALVFDAVTDPLVGSISDSLHSRWGRRHPFMYAATIPMAVTFYFVFHPPAGLGPSGLAAWLLTWTVLARGAMTLYHVPHLSLGAELSFDYAERARIVAYRVVGGFMGAAAFFLASARVFFQPSAVFPDGHLDPAAYPPMALTMGIAMGLLIFASAAGTHHRIPFLIRPRHAQPFSVRRLLDELREAAANRNFRFFALAILAFLVARGVSDGLGLFMGTYFWELETRHMFQITSLALVGVFLGAPVWAGLVRWYEKRTIFLGGCVSLSLFTSLAPTLKLVGWFPANDSPWFLPLIYGVTFVTAMGVSGAVAVPGAMLADIADEHELTTGRRQEGIFFGAFSFAAKASTGVGGWLAGLALAAIRFPQPESGGASVPPGSIDEGTLLALALIAGPALGVFSLVGIWLASHYALDRRRHGEIVTELRSRGSGTVGGGR